MLHRSKITRVIRYGQRIHKTENQRTDDRPACTSGRCNVKAIRYYQRISLIDEPQKPLQGYRRDQAREIAGHKCEVIQQRLKDLKAMQAELKKLITACRNNVDGENRCAIIETLAR